MPGRIFKIAKTNPFFEALSSGKFLSLRKGHIGNDVYRSAYFPADGSIWITDSDKIIFPLDAEKTLTSKKVKWEKVR